VCSNTRTIQQAYRFELDPNRTQRVLLAKSVGASRYVYNWGLAESKRQYELTGKRPRLGELKAQLVTLKQSECPWLYEVSAHVGQSALRDLNAAFERFFKGLKGDGPKAGYPRFKRKGEHDTARLYEVTVEDRHLRMHKIGRVRLKETCKERGFDGRVLSATISRRADRWFVSLAVERNREIVQSKPIRKPSDVVGVDLGLKNAAVIHDGTETRVVEPQRALRRNLKRLRRLDRRLARKQPGSRNREKALSERVFDCEACGFSLDRDENAAINLRRLGLAGLPADRREVTPVERKALTPGTSGVKPASVKQEATADGARRSTRRSTPKDALVRV
jgi:putative transposase